MRPSLTETHVTLWGAKTADYAVPINFLLQPESIAGLTKASGAKILVALGADPQLGIWQKALEVIKQILDLTLLRAATPKTPDAKGLIGFAAAISEQLDDHLSFRESRDNPEFLTIGRTAPSYDRRWRPNSARHSITNTAWR